MRDLLYHRIETVFQSSVVEIILLKGKCSIVVILDVLVSSDTVQHAHCERT